MAKLPICEFPHAVLKRPTRSVKRVDRGIKSFVKQLLDTMHAHPHCVGLAAPQVGKSVRIAVMNPLLHPKVKKGCGQLVLINPEIVAAENWELKREGCLSVPDFTANVKRALRIHLRALNIDGIPYDIRLDGFDAHVAQHEVDHLDGKLFLDRVANLRTDVFRRKTYR